MIKVPKIGVVVLTFNSERFIDRCLTSIEKQTYKNFVIYAVDNASTDNSAKRLLKHSCIILRQEINTGFAEGNNIGMRRALKDGCDAVMLLNIDAYLDNQTLERLVERMNRKGEKIGAVQSLILLHPNTDRINSSGNIIHYLGFGYTRDYKRPISALSSLTKNDLSIPYASGAAVLYTKRALEVVGLFDESFFLYHEDLDLSWRMRLEGFDIVLALEAKAYHEYSFSRSIKKYYYMERNRLMFLVKNFSLKYLILIFPLFFITEIGLDFYSFKNGFIIERMQAWHYFFKKKNRKRLLSSRKIVQQKRKLSDKEMVNYLTDVIAFQDVESVLLEKVGNPIFKLYFRLIVKPFI